MMHVAKRAAGRQARPLESLGWAGGQTALAWDLGFVQAEQASPGFERAEQRQSSPPGRSTWAGRRRPRAGWCSCRQGSALQTQADSTQRGRQ